MKPDFLSKANRIAVVGVSSSKKKWGWKIYEKLKSAGFRVYPLNPKHKKIAGDVCYPDLKSLPESPDVVITVVPPDVTEKIVKQCKNLGIGKIWMQPGSESKKAIKFCKNNNIEVIYNSCFAVNALEDKTGD